MRLSKAARSVGVTLDLKYTKEELDIELKYIKMKLKILLILSPIIIPFLPIYIFWLLLSSTPVNHPDYRPSFFDNLCEDISILINPPKPYFIGSGYGVLRDAKGNIVRDKLRYFSNPNGNYKG